MQKIFRGGLAVLFILGVERAAAFNGHIVHEGPLTLTVGDIKDVTELNVPQDVRISVKNNGAFALKVRLSIGGLVDEWYAIGETQRRLGVGPGGEAETTFQVAAQEGACSALYPVHVYADFQHQGHEVTAHAVQVFRSSFTKVVRSSTKAPGLPVNVVPANGALPLWLLQTYRVAWCFYEKPFVYTPVGWMGSSVESGANFLQQRILRNTAKEAIVMHPPWKPGGGTILAEYLLKLPDVTPIKLIFANAIRDYTATEPPSDGVTFRVWAGAEQLFERHTDSKGWVDAQIDLSKFAGKQVLLRLESHPGPKRDTTCDSSYWGEPMVIAGIMPAALTETDREKLREKARGMVESRPPPGKDEFVFRLEGDYLAAVALGRNGLCDSAIAFGRGAHCVAFDGLHISVLGHKVGAGPSPIVLRKVSTKRDRLSGRLCIIHRLSLADEEFDLTADVWRDRGGLRIRLQCPKRITDMGLGAADQKAPRVYYGHGYCIVEPEPFRADFGGHNLSTSHVGFDFEKDISLLVASDNPPDYLEVNPGERLYSLHTHLDATLVFVPSSAGAFDCARKYRPLFDKKAAAGLRRKAGRFVFDIWGGRYAEIAETMKRLVAYGLTDSLLTVHVWQRWGYDYRLPDIYPPQPNLGTVEDMQQIAEVCAEHDIPWGLHDNYIDFYPDATDYSYDDICFSERGEPIKAWINTGRDAQSYRWRPDHIMPFVRRNLRLIKPNLKPTHYFIDVFTSLPCFDYYDKHGNFHSMLETRKCWGEAFAWIRDYLGGDAPTTSEAGHDQLIGYLDGSDCQHMTLSPEKGWPHIRIACRDWERVPWFDAVLHDKFSLHGVGYPSRYKLAQEQSDQRILESDDYISAEILEGHALMIDRGGFGMGAVRKYWLAQDFVRSVALDAIEHVEFVDGDIHRQIITWESGARAYVNRGDKDWHVAGRQLPGYGYLAQNGDIESIIERIKGVIVEQSRGPSRRYVNARGYNQDGTLAIRPVAERAEYLGSRKFRLIVDWDVKTSPSKDLAIFTHFSSDRSERPDKIAFQCDGKPTLRTSRWTGHVKTGADWVVEIPKDYGAGEYEVTIGLWDPATGRRYKLDGDDDGRLRYRLGKLVAEGERRKVVNVRLIKGKAEQKPPSRWNIERMPIDFGPVITRGALRCEWKKDMIVVTPLPDVGSFTVAICVDKLNGVRGEDVRSVMAVGADGRDIRGVEHEIEGNLVKFETRKGEFAYEVLLRHLSR